MRPCPLACGFQRRAGDSRECARRGVEHDPESFRCRAPPNKISRPFFPSAKLYRDAETATQNRDFALGGDSPSKVTVGYYVRAVRDVLLGIYKGNEQKLGDWGFDVDMSARPAAAKTPTPNP